MDHRRWNVTRLSTLSKEPVSAMRSRHSELSPLPGSSYLADQEWTTIALAYLKELDVLSDQHRLSQGGGGSDPQQENLLGSGSQQPQRQDQQAPPGDGAAPKGRPPRRPKKAVRQAEG